jgi:hypothetical protein
MPRRLVHADVDRHVFADRRPLGTHESPTDGVLLVAAYSHDAVAVDFDRDPASGLAQGADPGRRAARRLGLGPRNRQVSISLAAVYRSLAQAVSPWPGWSRRGDCDTSIHMSGLTAGSLQSVQFPTCVAPRSRRGLRLLCLALVLAISSASGLAAIEFVPCPFNEMEGGEAESTYACLRMERNSVRRVTRIERRLKILVQRTDATLLRPAARAGRAVDVGSTYGRRLSIRHRRLLL